jgi:hypothetical protein
MKEIISLIILTLFVMFIFDVDSLGKRVAILSKAVSGVIE